MPKAYILLLVLCFFLSRATLSQQVRGIDLDEAVMIARERSLDSKIELTKINSAGWSFNTYKSSFLPKLSLAGSLPSYYRTISQITLPTGEYVFVQQNVASSGLNMNLTQNIGITGGQISISTSLNRIDNFGKLRNTEYTSEPFVFSYSQSNTFYNYFKWRKRIEPLRFRESQREYLESIEDISLSTVQKYFDLLIAGVQLNLDRQNLKNIDTIISITQSRFDIGTVELNEVLQGKVSLMNAKKSLVNSQLRMRLAQQKLAAYLNVGNDIKLSLYVPDTVKFFNVDPNVAFQKAQSNRKFVIEYQRRRMEAEEAVVKTKSETGPSIFVRANLGLAQSGQTLFDSYGRPSRNQSLVVGFNVPITDWGVNKSNRRRAQANLELENNIIAQEQLSIEQEILTQTLQWNSQAEQMEMARETRSLAEQRYEIAKRKYLQGSISYTDYIHAQTEKDRSTIDYIENLRNYWSLYYLVRRMTLFDFERDSPIELDQELVR